MHQYGWALRTRTTFSKGYCNLLGADFSKKVDYGMFFTPTSTVDDTLHAKVNAPPTTADIQSFEKQQQSNT